MRKTIYATLAIGSVMAITLAGTAQAEICKSGNTWEDVPKQLVNTSVTPGPGTLTVGWEWMSGFAPGNKVVLDLAEGGNLWPLHRYEVSPTSPATIGVTPGMWMVYGFSVRQRLVEGGTAWEICNSPMQYLGQATVTAPPAAPLKASVHAGRSR